MGSGKQAASGLLWNKAFHPGQKWTNTELETVLYWMRQILAILAGLVFGIIPITGALGNISFVVIYLASTFAYFQYLDLDQDEYNPWEMMAEGGMPSFATFMVTWITSYSLLHA